MCYHIKMTQIWQIGGCVYVVYIYMYVCVKHIYMLYVHITYISYLYIQITLCDKFYFLTVLSMNVQQNQDKSEEIQQPLAHVNSCLRNNNTDGSYEDRVRVLVQIWSNYYTSDFVVKEESCYMLIHLLDFLIQIFKEREEDLRRLSRPLECSCFRTSIWDETLYKVCMFPSFLTFGA